MRIAINSKQFKKDFKRIKKSHSQDLQTLLKIIQDLINEKPIDVKFKDHKLKGDFKNRRECHIKPDWLLIYKIEKIKNDKELLYLERLGTHADLF